MRVGDTVIVKAGATEYLKRKGFWADYMTSEIDDIIGTVQEDHRLSVGGVPHLSIDLGFEDLVGVPEFFLSPALAANSR